MSELRENYAERMIAIYGLEDSIVIQFCHLCETWADNSWNDKVLQILVEAHEENA